MEENNSCHDFMHFQSNGNYELIENDASCNSLIDDFETYQLTSNVIPTTNTKETLYYNIIS